MKFFNDKGIILRKTVFRERDEGILMLTHDNGKMSFVAYGSRMPKSRKAGSLQLFNTIEFLARTYARNRPSLEQVKVIEARGVSLAKKSLQTFAIASSLVKTADRSLAEGQHAEKIYDLLEQAFSHCDSEITPFVFFIKTFTMLGFFPDFRKCCHCHVKIDLQHKIGFCTENKGFAHQYCCQKEVDRKNVSYHLTGVPVTFPLCKTMAFFQKEEISKGVMVDVPKMGQKKMADILAKLNIHGSL